MSSMATSSLRRREVRPVVLGRSKSLWMPGLRRSASTRITVRPAWAKATARLLDVVVFPSPGLELVTRSVRTGSIPGEGKTTTSSNLAVAFAQAGRTVILLDADLRKPGIHKLFDLPNTVGLSSLLRSDEVAIDDVAQATEEERLRVVATGPLPPNPAELLG